MRSRQFVGLHSLCLIRFNEQVSERFVLTNYFICARCIYYDKYGTIASLEEHPKSPESTENPLSFVATVSTSLSYHQKNLKSQTEFQMNVKITVRLYFYWILAYISLLQFCAFDIIVRYYVCSFTYHFKIMLLSLCLFLSLLLFQVNMIME